MSGEKAIKRILLTGGGSAGHVTPNIALISRLQKSGYEIHYAGRENSIEQDLIRPLGIFFHSVSAGKFRRYFDLQNFLDIFRVFSGFVQSFFLIRRIQPHLLFSKGGFVSCPLVWAAWFNRVPVIVHESDITPGLANRLSFPFASRICFSFPETKKYVPKDRSVLTGIPVRESLLTGSPEKGRELCGFSGSKPVCLVMGGSLGSEVINQAIRKTLGRLLRKYSVCHICGKGGISKELLHISGYKQFEYVTVDQPDLLAMADLVISRAGATTLFELLVLRKPNLLIPLSRKASRGDQILNAESFQKREFSLVLHEEDLNEDNLVNKIDNVYQQGDSLTKTMMNAKIRDSVGEIMGLIDRHSL